MDTFLDTQSRWIYLLSRLSMEACLREFLVLVFGVFKDFRITVWDLKVNPLQVLIDLLDNLSMCARNLAYQAMVGNHWPLLKASLHQTRTCMVHTAWVSPHLFPLLKQIVFHIICVHFPSPRNMPINHVCSLSTSIDVIDAITTTTTTYFEF